MKSREEEVATLSKPPSTRSMGWLHENFITCGPTKWESAKIVRWTGEESKRKSIYIIQREYLIHVYCTDVSSSSTGKYQCLFITDSSAQGLTLKGLTFCRSLCVNRGNKGQYSNQRGQVVAEWCRLQGFKQNTRMNCKTSPPESRHCAEGNGDLYSLISK